MLAIRSGTAGVGSASGVRLLRTTGARLWGRSVRGSFARGRGVSGHRSRPPASAGNTRMGHAVGAQLSGQIHNRLDIGRAVTSGP